MPEQRAHPCWVWQIWQQVPACQEWARNVRLEGLAQVREFLQVHEAAREEGSNLVICSTAVEQVAHVSEVAREQAQGHISGYLLLSKRQVSLSCVGSSRECFVDQVAQILHGGHQLCKPGSLGEVPGEVIPQVGFIARQIRSALERVGTQQVRVQGRQRSSHGFLQVAADASLQKGLEVHGIPHVIDHQQDVAVSQQFG